MLTDQLQIFSLLDSFWFREVSQLIVFLGLLESQSPDAAFESLEPMKCGTSCLVRSLLYVHINKYTIQSALVNCSFISSVSRPSLLSKSSSFSFRLFLTVLNGSTLLYDLSKLNWPISCLVTTCSTALRQVYSGMWCFKAYRSCIF